MYEFVDVALIRAAAYPDGWQIPPPPEPAHEGRATGGGTGGAAGLDVQGWRCWIERVARERYLCDTVALASPSLMRAVRDIRAGRLTEPKRVRRAGLALYRYALRLRHRATPFGLFAGVAPVRFGAGTQVRRGDDHRLFLRPDAAWLSTVIDGLEHCPELLRRLPVVVDATATVRGDRLIIPFRRSTDDRTTGRGAAPGEVNVRRTWPVQVIVAHASAPIPVAHLVDRASAEIGGASRVRLERLVAELVHQGILRTALRPPMTGPEALRHVLDVLDTVAAAEIAVVGPTVRTLRDVHTALQRDVPATPCPGSPAVSAGIRDVAAAMTGLPGVAAQPVAADLRLDCTVRLPEGVAREAAAAADALLRLTPRPLGSRAWRDYRARFVNRYGTNVLVPVLELVDPELGLGYPAGYRSSPHPLPGRHLTGRDERLLALAQQAASTRTREIILTEELIDELADGEPVAETPHLDLCFRLHAETPRALDAGNFILVISGATPAAGATAGRFLHVLDAEDRDRMIDAYTRMPTLSEGARSAQISSPPFLIRTENVARTPGILPGVIAIGEHQLGGVRLADLAVTADTGPDTGPEAAAAADSVRLYLVSRATGAVIEPVVMNAVDLPSFTHPLARFLCELPRAHTAAVVPFQWGAAVHLPFLPRIRYGRAVLVPATWRLRAADLPGLEPDPETSPETCPDVWTDALRTWRRQWAVPDVVEVGDDDRRLRLDLQLAADRTILRRALDRAGHVTLREATAKEEATVEEIPYGWFGGRPHEITLALASAQPPRPVPQFDDVSVIGCRDHGRLPGASRWVQARLSSHHVSGIVRRLPALFDRHFADSGPGEPPVWWFTRGSGQLRLSFRLPRPNTYGQLAAHVGSWAADLRRSGLLRELCWETTFAQPYGRCGEQSTTVKEDVFAADSITALAQLAITGTSTHAPLALTAAGLIDMVVSLLGDRRAGMRWLIDHACSHPARRPERAIRDETLRLTHPRDGYQALCQLPGGERVAAAWAARRDALEAYRALLVAENRPPESALVELVEGHLRRTDADAHACRQLARATALTWHATGEHATEEKAPQ